MLQHPFSQKIDILNNTLGQFQVELILILNGPKKGKNVLPAWR